jgi:hypothetical protein
MKILASHKRVMPKLYSNDKWPNIDGYVEIQDSNNVLTGRLFVQAKTLSKNHNLKFSCPVSFFSSCEINPCLLLGVDNLNEKVYWLYFDAQNIKKIDFKKNKCTKTIQFDQSNYLDKNTKTYIDAWEGIVRDNQYRFQRYDELKSSYEIIVQNLNKAIGQTSNNFIKLHLFLDELNYRLDNQFLIVKNRFYPRTWKLGIAYYNYEPQKISYVLFPVPIGKNDVQIKEVDKTLHDKIQKEGLGFTGHFVENPIEKRPLEYAKEIIASKTLKIAENKLLDHSGSELLACEFVFAFVDKFNVQMGLERKDTYTIAEMETAFYKYLPLWLIETYDLLLTENRNYFNERIKSGRVRYFDPNWINEITVNECDDIANRVNVKVKNNNDIPRIPIGNKQMPIGLFIEFLNYLKQNQREIIRVYKPKDFSRFEDKVNRVWNVFSKEDTDYNLRVFFKNLPEAYNTLIKNNFPLLEKELSLFKGADKIAVFWDVKNEYIRYGDSPTYEIFFLRSTENNAEQSVEIVSSEDIAQLREVDLKIGEIYFKGRKYRITSMISALLDFIYEDTPMLNFIYGVLEERLREYFKN